MNYIKNQKGVALITSLLLTLIILGIIMLAIYFVTRGTVLSGFEKRYSTARDASQGGVEIITKDIIPKTINSMVVLSAIGNYGGMMSTLAGDPCFTAKLTQATVNWPAGCDSTLTLRDPNNPSTITADMTFQLNSAEPNTTYNVYTKIVDTVPGNTDTSGLDLEGAGVVDASSGIIVPQHFPYVYRIEVQGELDTGANVPEQRANLSAIYAY